MYATFSRTWWKKNKSWPNGLEPEMGRKTYYQHNVPTIQEARDTCHEWNATHEPGRYSRKMEFEEQ